MRKLKNLIIVACVVFIVAACNQTSSSDWYGTKDETIEIGLQEEGINRPTNISVEEYEGETIVFYESEGALGVASITESEEGYKWFKNSPTFSFDVTGDLPYTTGKFSFETESGLQVPILYGEIFDNSVQITDLQKNEDFNDAKLIGNSNLFFTFLETPLES